MNQGRQTWRHDAVLQHLVEYIKKDLEEDTKVFADLPGLKINDGTIPSEICITSQRPDITIINNTLKHITMVEWS